MTEIVRRPGVDPGSGSPNVDAGPVADDERAGLDRSGRIGGGDLSRQPRWIAHDADLETLGRDDGAVERPHPDAGLDDRDRARIGDPLVGRQPPVHQPRDRDALGRDPLDIGVDADLAHEGAIGPRDRAGAQHDGIGPAIAV
jgi:hypothetical protein